MSTVNPGQSKANESEQSGLNRCELDQCDTSIGLPDEDATVAFGRKLALSIDHGAIFFLEGSLGAGKTTLTRGMLSALGHSGAVKSPTYTLVEPYILAGKSVYHFDLYRLAEPEELEYMGIRDYFEQEGICIVEWSSRGLGYLPSPDITVSLEVDGVGRKADLRASTPLGNHLLQRLRSM